MSTSVMTIIVLFSVLIWIGVSRESVKPSENVNWRKMLPLLALGTVSTFVLLISLIHDLM